MDLILIPQALMIFYGGLVLSCGGVLGFIVGRNVRRRIPPPDPGESLERRVSVLERELEASEAELARLASETDFMRELRAPKVPREQQRDNGGRSVA